MKIYLALPLACLGAITAHAAPYCVTVQGLPDQCIFADGQECQARASQLGGACTANRAELVVAQQVGHQQFCLVTDGRSTLCIYADRNTCVADAAKRKTACVEAASPPQVAQDPYEIRRPY